MTSIIVAPPEPVREPVRQDRQPLRLLGGYAMEAGTPLGVVGKGDRLSFSAVLTAGQEALARGQHVEARALFEIALRGLRHRSQAGSAAALLRSIARTHQIDGDTDAALDCLTAALAVSELARDRCGVGHALNQQGVVAFQQGSLDEAQALYAAAFEVAVEVDDARLRAMTAQNRALLANVRGDLPEAIECYEASLEHSRGLGLTADVLVTLHNLGLLYTDMLRWDDAERVYREGVQMSTALGDVAAQVAMLESSAEMWVARGDYARARAVCDDVLQRSTRAQSPSAHGEAEKIYGIVAREAGDHATAERHFARAEAIATEREDLLLAAETAREIADLQRRQGRSRDTLKYLNRAHRIFMQLRARRDVADVERRTARLEEDLVQVARRWGESIEAKDRYTQGHCARVADLACAVAARVGMDAVKLFWFRIGALLHDVGKLMLPEEVLNKPGKLVAAEWQLMQRHTTAGVEMLAGVEFPWDVRPIIESHHERWDGRGYPHGLAREEIPLAARILCVADVYDALVSKRSYKRALTHHEAMELMRRDVGHVFDPIIFAQFEEVVREWVARAGHHSAGPQPAADHAGDDAADGRHADAGDVDAVTRLPTRRAFFAEAAKALYDGIREGRPLSLLVVDVNRFKQVNEQHGHLQGDDVLRRVADLLRHHTRGGDFVARYVGDEFIVLLPNTPPDDAVALAERLRNAAETALFPLRAAPDEALRLSLSIGHATAPQHGQTVDSLLAAADSALHQVKRRRRAGAGSTTGSMPVIVPDVASAAREP